MTAIDMYGTMPEPPAEEPQGCFSIAGFVKRRWENNQHYVDQFVSHPWGPAIRDAAESLHELCPRINISQIKEKFGGLRFYIDIPDDLAADEIPVWAKGDVEKVREHANRIIARAEGWCARRDHEARAARAATPAGDPQFEHGARAAAESMRLYFCDEDERPIFDGLTDSMLDEFEKGAVADGVRDEQLRVERLGGGGPRPWQTCSASHDRGGRSRVVWVLKRRLPDEFGAHLALGGQRVDAGHLQRGVVVQKWQKPGQAFGQHGLSRAR